MSKPQKASVRDVATGVGAILLWIVLWVVCEPLLELFPSGRDDEREDVNVREE